MGGENTTHIAIFNGKSIRRKLVNDEWFFSVIDIVGVLTESTIPKRYWSDLKAKLKEEGFESYDKIVQLKLKSGDGKEFMESYKKAKEQIINKEFDDWNAL